MKSVWFSLDVAPFVISLGMLHAIVLWNVWSNSTVLKTWQQFSFVGTADAFFFFYSKYMRFLFKLEKKSYWNSLCIREESPNEGRSESALLWRPHERGAVPREPLSRPRTGSFCSCRCDEFWLLNFGIILQLSSPYLLGSTPGTLVSPGPHPGRPPRPCPVPNRIPRGEQQRAKGHPLPLCLDQPQS